jgi:hypothetical protein
MGAFIYCDVRGVASSASLQLFFKRPVMQKGNVKVWELQTAEIISSEDGKH